MKSIPLAEPLIGGNEWKYVKECLDTGWVSSVGSYVDRFEEMVARYVGAKYAVAMVNGTAALHLSLLVAGVQPDDEVIVPTLTFIAPVNVVRYCQAQPVFMDCDPNTLCLDVKKTAKFLEEEGERHSDGYIYNKKTGRRISAIIPVHIFGHPVDMDPLVKICKEYNICVVEDATESLGSEYKGRKTGSLADIGCFSFNGNKIITTGGGGMVVTNNEEWARQLRHLSTQAKKDPLCYDHDEVGYNYRLTNIQAALGVAQMEKLDEYVKRKREIAAQYQSFFQDIDGVSVLNEEKVWAKSNFWLSTIQVAPDIKDSLLFFLIKQKIQARPIWNLIHKLPMYKEYQVYGETIPQAEHVWQTCLNIPCSVNITEQEVEYVAETIKKYFKDSMGAG